MREIVEVNEGDERPRQKVKRRWSGEIVCECEGAGATFEANQNARVILWQVRCSACGVDQRTEDSTRALEA